MIEVADARVCYDVAGLRTALAGVSCTISPGEHVVLAGANGSGKSTLAALMCALRLADVGDVRVDGLDPRIDDERRELRRRVGLVRQSPADQLIASLVGEEVAFGPRNLGADEADVARRVERALAEVGLNGAECRDVRALSGGEQQRVALAGVLAMDPDYLVLDEVTSTLDGAVRAAHRALFRRLVRERGIGIVQITHDPLETLGADRVLVLDKGRILWQGSPSALLVEPSRLWDRTFAPSAYIEATRRALALGYSLARGTEPADLLGWLRWARECGRISLTDVSRLRDALARSLGSVDAPGAARELHAKSAAPAVRGPVNGSFTASRAVAAVSLADVSFSYDGIDAISHVSMSVRAGEIVLVAGRSGSGKSTLAALAAGLAVPDAGAVRLGGRPPQAGDVGFVLQSPEQQLFCDTVADELAFAPLNLGCAPAEVADRVAAAAARLGVGTDLLERDPFTLSEGQARRVGIASILSLRPAAIVLDEPGCGLDGHARGQLHRLVCALAGEGLPIILVSHDLEEWLAEASRVALLGDGSLRWFGAPEDLVRDPSAFTRSGLDAPESWALRTALDTAFGPAGADEGGTSGKVSGANAISLSATESGSPLVEELGLPPTSDPAPPAAPLTPFVLLAGPAAPTTVAPEPPLTSVDARVKIILLLALGVAVFAAGALWILLVWCAVLAAAFGLAGIGPRVALKAVRPVFLLLALIACANLISCDGTADIRVAGPLGLSAAGGLRTLAAAVRLIVLAGVSYAVAMSTTPSRVAAAAARLACPLTRLGAPVAQFSLALSVALRCIPLVGDELARIRRAQRARGARFDAGSVRVRARAWISVLTPLMVGLFRRSDRLAESMDARCYADAASTMPAPRPLSRRDAIALATGLALMTLLVAAAHLV